MATAAESSAIAWRFGGTGSNRGLLPRKGEGVAAGRVTVEELRVTDTEPPGSAARYRRPWGRTDPRAVREAGRAKVGWKEEGSEEFVSVRRWTETTPAMAAMPAR